MCGLYGVLSYGNKVKDMAEITEALAVESAVRGTDATGIAYNKNGKLIVFKKSKSAYEMTFSGFPLIVTKLAGKFLSVE